MHPNPKEQSSKDRNEEPKIVDEEVGEPIAEQPKQERKIGVVTNCIKLNVRKEPDHDAPVLLVIPLMDEVVVDLEQSTDHFYKVVTATGVEGYCMKNYIALSR